MEAARAPAGRATLGIETGADGTVSVVLGGAWRMHDGVPSSAPAVRAVGSAARIRFDTGALEDWDGSVLALVERVGEAGAARGVPVDRSGLPEGARRLLDRADRPPERAAPSPAQRPPFFARIGVAALEAGRDALDFVIFIGDLARALGRWATGRAHLRRPDLLLQIELTGARSLGIVTLVAFLVGAILAFAGAIELRAFGADIYTADLVGVAVVRELGALMTAFVVAGRTGAAFAAELGSMRVSQELDAFATLDLSPFELLVAPRILALTLMMPLLTLYADVVGVFGGGLVGVSMLGISPQLYLLQTMKAVTAAHLRGGLAKAAVYGLLVAAAGCRHGLRSGRSAAAVGEAATQAVVSGMVQVIAACGVFAVVFFEMGW